MDSYNYTGYYNDIMVEGELGTEGILLGRYGNLHFKRCQDGFSIINSSFLGTGFISWPTSADIGLPAFINGLPVTETHQTISINSAYPIAIEAKQLKRAYLRISNHGYDKQHNEGMDSFHELVSLLLRDKEIVNQGNAFTEVAIGFFKEGNSIDCCEIQCNERCMLHSISAKHLKVNADSVVLKGKAFEGLEQVEFSGNVYPFVYDDWQGVNSNIGFFAGANKLKLVEGSLRGEECWCFKDCTSLEKVHLSNGITIVPPRSFENCKSLIDLYIPDTVKEIGEYAFSGCKKLKTVHLPSAIQRISKGMFFECEALTKCYLSDDIESIEDDAFRGCLAMKKPWIPKNIKKISKTAFDNPDWSQF